MTQQQCQLTNSRTSTLELRNKQTNRHRSGSYIHSRLLRPSDVINDFVFKDKDLGHMVKDFVIKAKYKSLKTKKETVKAASYKILGNYCKFPTEEFIGEQKFPLPQKVQIGHYEPQFFTVLKSYIKSKIF